VAVPHHGNWRNVEDDEDVDVGTWYPDIAFDDPDSFDVDPPDYD
jgi:hypothetical protein